MNYPVKKVYVTQKWGVNASIYARFGFKGHNGVDFRLFNENGVKASTCLLFAPHDGVVKERRYDANGYGNYLKIESSKEGSVLGHLKEFKVNINKQVKEGDLIGICNNTGWSSGPHLHWGYYRNPRNRSNGYGGTIDPTPYIKPSTTMTNKLLEHMEVKSEDEGIQVWDKETAFLESERKKNRGLSEEVERLKADNSEYYAQAELRKKDLQKFLEALAKKLFLPAKSDQTDILGSIERLLKVEDQLTDANKTISKKEAEFAKKEVEWKTEIDELKSMLEKANNRIDKLEQDMEAGNEEKASFNLFRELVRRISELMKGKK
jgi:hypothetical protein